MLQALSTAYSLPSKLAQNNMSDNLLITCPSCKATFKRTAAREKECPLTFCAYCGHRLHPMRGKMAAVFSHSLAITIEPDKIPKKDDVVEQVGPYQILKSIGKGGMGEVFLAYDTTCGRKIALKKIRSDLLQHPLLQSRFLREARITSQLTHPTIVPIYTIHEEVNNIYYTMPYVEGQTLRAALRHAKEIEVKKQVHKDLSTTIPALIRIFLQICQACAYAHSHGVLHRDLKPENFIIGKYGQVIIVDWGLAKMIGEEEKSEQEKAKDEVPEPIIKKTSRHISGGRITKMGKVVGTVAYMAPERAFGKPSTIQTDIYSLGVVLYQILTLHVPFHRKNIAEFKKNWQKEQYIPPEVMAPYREVPPILSEIVKKCLSPLPEERFQSVDELIQSLESYIEGRSEWFYVTTLNIHNKNDWEFQENILLANHTAITGGADASDWAIVMISKEPFTDNTRIEATLRLGKSCQGIGFLFSLPEAETRRYITEGYCLWLSANSHSPRKTKLLRSSVTVMEAPDCILPHETEVHVRVEKIDQHIYCYINNLLQFSYTSHIPIVGSHVGILARDADFTIDKFSVSIGSQNITVGCLAVPDAFLANKNYDKALHEYRRIGQMFQGRAEGRDALFRAGITLLEEAKAAEMGGPEAHLYSRAHEEFGKLRNTSGAPLEYLGKALMYESMGHYEEEMKCYELAFRRYKRHPLLPIIEEELAFRMHESSRQSRRAAYECMALALRFLPHIVSSKEAARLFTHLQKHWEELPFIRPEAAVQDEEVKRLRLIMILGFWLHKPYIIQEAINAFMERPILPIPLICDALFLLLEMKSTKLCEDCIYHIRSLLSPTEFGRFLPFTDPIEKACKGIKGVGFEEERIAAFHIRQAIQNQEIFNYRDILKQYLETKNTPYLDSILMEAYLYLDDMAAVEKIIERCSIGQKAYPEAYHQEHPAAFVYGCALARLKGERAAMAYFASLAPLPLPYPRSYLLGAHVLVGHISAESSSDWMRRSFVWEKEALYNQLILFYHVTGNQEKETAFRMLTSCANFPTENCT